MADSTVKSIRWLVLNEDLDYTFSDAEILTAKEELQREFPTAVIDLTSVPFGTPQKVIDVYCHIEMVDGAEVPRDFGQFIDEIIGSVIF